MSTVINSSTGGELNPGLGTSSGGPVATAIAIVRNTFLSTTLGDAISAQVSYGWDQVTGEARIVLPAPNGAIGDNVMVTMGAGHNSQRFAGTLVEFDTALAPHAVTAVCKGPLYAIEQYENGQETIETSDGLGRPGLAFEDLLGATSGTLQEIVAAVLNVCNVSFSLGNFDNPADVYGLLAPEEFTWGTHETAAAYIARILGASAGYRLFDSTDGNIYLKQADATPAGSPDIPAFTLGRDIFGESSAVTSNINQRGAVLVEGYDYLGLGPATSGIVGGGNSIFRVSSTLIETDTFATTLANFWLTQVNRPQKLIRLTTPRDDLIGPLQTHFVDAVTLGVSDKMYVKSFTAEITANGEFTQRLVYIVGT